MSSSLSKECTGLPTNENPAAYIDADFIYDYITGVSDGVSEAKRAGIEVPPGRRFGVLLTMPQETGSPKIAAKIYNSFRAEGENTPLLFCRCTGNYVLTLIESCPDKQMCALVKSVEENSGMELFTVYENNLCGCKLYSAYDRLEKQLERVFYAENGENIVKANDANNSELGQFNMITDSILKGDVKGIDVYMSSLFRLIGCAKPPVKCVKKQLVKLYADMLMQNMQHNNACMIKRIARIESATRLSQVRDIVSDTAKRFAELNIPENGEAYSALVRETVHIINENIGNEDLSLRWIAGNILYTNVDYLGKVFKKETGRNFSHYVMEKRMEAAKSLILEGGNYKIYEVAESVGFGSNSQYFSQVFKKYTGVSPLEYKEYSKELRRRNASGN